MALEVTGDADVLEAGAELVADLLIDGGGQFLADQHAKSPSCGGWGAMIRALRPSEKRKRGAGGLRCSTGYLGLRLTSTFAQNPA